MRKRFGKLAQADQFQRGIDSLPRLIFLWTTPPGEASALRLRTDPDVAAHRAPRVQGRVLEHHHARRIGARDRGAVGLHAALRRRIESRHETQQGGLSTTARTQQRDEFARLDREADILQHGQRGAAQRELMTDMAHVDACAVAQRRCGGVLIQHFGHGYHLSNPFCQASKRSRRRNSNVIRPEHMSAMTSSAAYIFE